MMPIPYRKMFVMWPPRPEGSADPSTLDKYPGWWAQRKFNGTRSLVFIDPDGNVHLRTRHQEEHKAYKLSYAMDAALTALLDRGDGNVAFEAGKWQVFDAELMNNKTIGVKDRMVLFDILVHNGSYLTGTTVRERYEILTYGLGMPDTIETETGRGIALQVNDNVWLAEVFEDTFADRFAELTDMDEVEGLVLKDPGGVLKPGVSEKNNSLWLVRVRKPHKNYRH
jgi:ATP-dependent DNA ligase